MLVIISTAVTPAMAKGTKEATSTEVKSVTASGLWTTVLNLEFEDVKPGWIILIK